MPSRSAEPEGYSRGETAVSGGREFDGRAAAASRDLHLVADG